MSDFLSGISAINSASPIQGVGAVSQPLTEETKKKLESYGIDTKDIKTENEGQKKLKEVESAQQNQQTNQVAQLQQAQPSQQQDGSMSLLISNVKELAADIGVPVGYKLDIEKVLEDIKTKIQDIKKQNPTDENEKAKAASFQYRYETLNSEYLRKKSSQNMLTGALQGLAAYNMAMLK